MCALSLSGLLVEQADLNGYYEHLSSKNDRYSELFFVGRHMYMSQGGLSPSTWWVSLSVLILHICTHIPSVYYFAQRRQRDMCNVHCTGMNLSLIGSPHSLFHHKLRDKLCETCTVSTRPRLKKICGGPSGEPESLIALSNQTCIFFLLLFQLITMCNLGAEREGRTEREVAMHRK